LLQLSGEKIGLMDDHSQQRADWVLFLLDEIKGFLPADEYAAMLAQLSTAIADRSADN
jgi:hypothetical protein